VTLPDPRRAATLGVVLWGGYVVWSVTQWLVGQTTSPTVGRIVSDVAFAVFGLFALGCAAMAAVSNRGRARAAWVFVGIGAAAWFAAIAGSDLRSPLGAVGVPFASVADVGFIVFPIATCVALLLLPVGPGGPSTMRLLMDGLVVAGSLFLIAWIVVLRDVFEAGGTDPVVFAVRLAYPILDLVAITVGVLVVIRARGAARMSVASLTVGIVLMSISNDVLYHLVENGRGRANLLYLGWATSLLAVGLGALAGCGQRRAGHIPVHDTLWLPYVPMSVAGVVVIADLAKPASAVVLLVSASLVIVVMLRQFLVMGSNQRLLAVVAEQALQDPLTGLANRYLFNDRLHHAVELHRRELFGALAVLTLDLDDFKLVNDGLGHAAGDALLVDVAARIRSAVRSGDTIARLGGDEFAILIEKGPETPDSVAQRVVEAFEQPFLVEGHLLPIRPSVGLSVAPARDRDLRASDLLKQSDLAMYAAKRTRGSGVVTFASDTGPLRGLQDDAPRLGLLGDLRAAIEHGELTMVYQPKVDLRVDGPEVVGVEALVRWPHPEHGLLTPAEFLPLVRRHDLMAPMTTLVFDLVFADSAHWREAGRTVPVAVNVFAPSFDDPELPDRLIAALGRYGLAAAELTLEITEELVIQDLPRARQVLERLRELGIRLSVDDFGSGFGGLHYLRELPVDEVKLDRQFVMPILEDRRTAAIVRAVIDLAHDLGVTCVAEGVENAAVASRLQEYGCDLAQGYHFSPPIAASQLLDTMTNLDPQTARS